MSLTMGPFGTSYHLEADSIDLLRDLQQANIDSSKGFKEVAIDIESDQLALRFNRLSEIRFKQAIDLGRLITSQPEPPITEGSWLGVYHRTWIATKAVLTSGDVDAILAEVKRGEQYLLHKYEEALKEKLTTVVSKMLDQQYVAMQRSYSELGS